MPGIRVDRLLASTAVALLLAASAGSVLADPATATGDKPMSSVPAAAAPTSAAPVSAAPAPRPHRQPSAARLRAGRRARNAKAGRVRQRDANASQPWRRPTTPASATPSAATVSTPAASSPETAAAPTAAPPGPDAAISDQLRELANGKFDHTISNKKDRMQIDAFYSGRNYKPLWITDGQPNDSAKAAIAYLGHVDADGLFPSDYPVPNFASLSTPADLANAELELTMSVITYAHHASIGRVAFSRVSADIEYDRPAPEPADVLASIADAKDVASALDSYEPHTPGYLALKAKLAEIRAGKADQGKPAIAGGPVLKTRHAGQPRAGIARAARRARRRRHHLRQTARRSGEEIPEGTPDRGDRHADRRHRRRHRRPAARSRRRRHHRQYGTLALGAARFPGYLRHRQPARLHAARHA